jgi:chromatin segregation and condensation protein Rec8/ScpA/Scc1 (kleisin family)
MTRVHKKGVHTHENFDKYDLVVTVLALLEMAKLMMIKVFQAGEFQIIYITGRFESVTHEEALKLVSAEEGVRNE